MISNNLAPARSDPGWVSVLDGVFNNTFLKTDHVVVRRRTALGRRPQRHGPGWRHLARRLDHWAAHAYAPAVERGRKRGRGRRGHATTRRRPLHNVPSWPGRCNSSSLLWIHKEALAHACRVSLVGTVWPTECIPGRLHLLRRDATLLICAGRSPQPARSGRLMWWTTGPRGGACARSRVLIVCARALSLISVRDPGWFRVGNMMDGGMIPLVQALRPLGL
jgi:hypothetical protein